MEGREEEREGGREGGARARAGSNYVIVIDYEKMM